MKSICTAKGNADYWVDFWELPFKGAGDYNLPNNEVVKIAKAEKTSPKKDWDEKKAHESAVKYGYGQMFLGEFFRE